MGLTYWQMQRKIILPQAIKISIPPIVNTYLGMFKDTSLVAIVSLTDLLLATRQAFADPEWRPFFVEGYVFIACIYWAFCYFMSKYSQYLERALSTGHKT
jgi:general L-amino acid transport system permease protein